MLNLGGRNSPIMREIANATHMLRKSTVRSWSNPRRMTAPLLLCRLQLSALAVNFTAPQTFGGLNTVIHVCKRISVFWTSKKISFLSKKDHSIGLIASACKPMLIKPNTQSTPLHGIIEIWRRCGSCITHIHKVTSKSTASEQSDYSYVLSVIGSPLTLWQPLF